MAADSAFAAPFFEDSTLTDTLAAMKRLGDTATYYWHMRAVNGTTKSAWTKARFVTVADAGVRAHAIVSGNFAAGIHRAELAGMRSGIYLIGLRIDGADRMQRVFIP